MNEPKKPPWLWSCAFWKNLASVADRGWEKLSCSSIASGSTWHSKSERKTPAEMHERAVNSFGYFADFTNLGTTPATKGTTNKAGTMNKLLENHLVAVMACDFRGRGGK